ncbi:unnamed protein product, partial [Symbiodinium pilosum]
SAQSAWPACLTNARWWSCAGRAEHGDDHCGSSEVRERAGHPVLGQASDDAGRAGRPLGRQRRDWHCQGLRSGSRVPCSGSRWCNRVL